MMSGRRFSSIRRWQLALAAFAGLVLLLLVLVWGPFLLTLHPSSGLNPEQRLKARNDVRTTLVQVLAGLALGGGLVVTYRTFRQNQSDQDRSYRQREAERRDGSYAKAVEQLGHDGAAVRLGAMYSLTSLGQGDPDRRQTVVDVLCAYLRMPFTAPEPAGGEPEPGALPHPIPGPTQELQVRMTAQRILTAHLRRSAGEQHWQNIDLDLTGAVLVDADLRVEVRSAAFSRVVFHGVTRLDGACFADRARFDGACFKGRAMLRAVFKGEARFDGAVFERPVYFNETVFEGAAWFNEASFRKAWFSSARFSSVVFDGARFNEPVQFDHVKFRGSASFRRCQFSGRVNFDATELSDRLTLEGATARITTAFHSTTWPSGWTLAETADPEQARSLVRAV